LDLVHRQDTDEDNVSETGYVSVLRWRAVWHLLCWVR
jgi:hypothetical protein